MNAVTEKRARIRMPMNLVASIRLVDYGRRASFVTKLNQKAAKLVNMTERGAELHLPSPFAESDLVGPLRQKLNRISRRSNKQIKQDRLFRFGPTEVTLGLQIHIPETNKHIEVLGWVMWLKHAAQGLCQIGIRFSEWKNMEIFNHYLGGKAIVLHWK